MIHRLSLSLLLLLACDPKSPSDADTGGNTEPAGSTTVSTEPVTSTTDTASAAGSSSSGGSTAADETGPGSMHAACDLPFPDPVPALPDVNMENGHPRFDDWSAISCDEVPLDRACGSPGDLACNGFCLHGVPGGPGVCSGSDIDIWCDGDGEAIGFSNHACWMCSPADLHALACCAQLAGFDCRTWPYPADGPIGSVCARHEDCEPGLVCGPHTGAGYGICQCPGTDPQSVVPAAFCLE